MHRSPRATLLILSLILILSACTWIKLTAGGEKVTLGTAAEVQICKKLGRTEVTLLDKVAGIKRGEKKVEQELQTLARNSGAKMGGDTVLASSTIDSGTQSFEVYRCGRP